ncbi:MAG: hypothetical protein OEW75_11800 [Cyclobacteriaceae bacterium]|nr:hypothetical protein [Cyclobacteriaceae bacterium]
MESYKNKPYNELSVAQLVDLFSSKMKNESLEFSEIRKQMEAFEIENDKISTIIRLIDSQIHRDLELVQHNRKAKSIMFMGLAIALVGITITIISYFGSGRSYVIMYGAIAVGISMFFGGMAKKR